MVTLALLLLAVAPARVEVARVAMGCTYAIVAHGDQAAAEAALDEVDRIDRLMSHYKPGSALSRLNREASAAPVHVEPELFAFLEQCQEYARQSHGAFDVTVGPLMKVWGFFDRQPRVPAAAALAVARHAVGFGKLILDGSTVKFARPGMEVDLGGIAKGYAVDRAVEVLRRHGVKSALVSAGGSSVYALGHPPDATAWEVHTRDGRTLRVVDRAISMAGHTEQSFVSGGRRYGHIMDPRRGHPVQGVGGVIVIGHTGVETDALDDVLFVQGDCRSLGAYPGNEAVIVLDRRTIICKGGAPAYHRR